MPMSFGKISTGEEAMLYTITCGEVTAQVTNYGAALVSLTCPDRFGTPADVVLGYDDAEGYRTGTCFLGATVGRSANRTAGASVTLNGKEYRLTPNENGNNLHSGPDTFHTRFWDVLTVDETSVVFRLISPNGDQGFPGNADIRVTYSLDEKGGLHITYDAICDQDSVFNLTNHSYFNLAGHNRPELAGSQLLTIPGRHFCPDDAQSIPTGELRSVAGTPMDFRSSKPVLQDIDTDYEPLKLQGGYDHNWEVYCNPCAILQDTASGRTLSVYTDCPGIQFYAGNYLEGTGKGGTFYGKHSGVALETQYYPNAMNTPGWKKPIVKAGQQYHSETVYRLTVE